jgi:hypothetical protein
MMMSDEPKKTKREKFVKLANSRVRRAVKTINIIGNLANKANYEYTMGDVAKIIGKLHKTIEDVEYKFGGNGDKSEEAFDVEAEEEEGVLTGARD